MSVRLASHFSATENFISAFLIFQVRLAQLSQRFVSLEKLIWNFCAKEDMEGSKSMDSDLESTFHWLWDLTQIASCHRKEQSCPKMTPECPLWTRNKLKPGVNGYTTSTLGPHQHYSPGVRHPDPRQGHILWARGHCYAGANSYCFMKAKCKMSNT